MRRSVSRALAAGAASALLGGMLMVAAPAVGATTEQTYIVLYRSTAVPTDAATKVSRAGGTLVASYGPIGVGIARSSSTTFRSTLEKDSKVASVAATGSNAFHLSGLETEAAADDPVVETPVSDSDNLSGLQWDMRQIHTPEAHEITGGSSTVIVGDIDTGLDYQHPDLAPNVDFANSVSCVGGVPNQDPAAWDDHNGHGTHTAGTIAAAANGVGIVGVAPNVRIAGIKAGNDAGFFFPEAVICAFMWAGSHGIDVTNNSYFADPWLFNCRNDKQQKAIYSAEQRAIRWAQSKGTLVVAAEGNQSDDLAHPTADATSPDDTTPVVRDITNACAVVPTELPGVVGVTANGNRLLKSYYSSYGTGSADVVAPGGDRRFQVTAEAPNGRVLSTYPAELWSPSPLIVQDCSVSPCAVYAYLQGTSMASPHVAGVAALVASQHPDWTPGAIAAVLASTADPLACPTAEEMAIYANFPAVDNGAPQVCTGGTGYNSFNGNGQVNALGAVEK